VSYEIFEALSVESAARLKNLGLKNVEIRHGEAFESLAELGSFDRILIHGVVEWMPESLLQALKDGGVMVLGRRGGTKHAMLTKVVKTRGEVAESELCTCRLGSLIGVSKN
jgi:protein-L-isoaspartate(D-aspartate) O-methyltransferase